MSTSWQSNQTGVFPRNIINNGRSLWRRRRVLVRDEPQVMVQRLFASYPSLATPRAEALGIRHDGSADALVRRATDT